jgi:thymidylate synthase (FAD)
MTPQEQVVDDKRYTPLYDHGFVGLIEKMGSDEGICRAARVSYGTGTKSVSDDRNLIRYLKRHKHTSPFEMAEVLLHLKMPIFVMRQWIRHRTANVNEYSARYSELSNEFYVPAPDYIAPQSTTNNQGRAGSLSDEDKQTVICVMNDSIQASYYEYERLLGKHPDDHLPKFSDEFDGISRELARIPVPVANYTECYWKIDLHNLFHFLALRMDSHAQQEIRDYATAVYELVKEHFPLSCEAFEDYQFHARTLSRMDLLALMDMLQGCFVADANHYDMSKREYTEFVDFFKPSAIHSQIVFKTEK